MFNNKKLVDFLEREKISYADFGERVGVSKTMVCGIAKGYKQPSAALLKRIAGAMGCHMEDLIE